jgi:hypothetical protein
VEGLRIIVPTELLLFLTKSYPFQANDRFSSQVLAHEGLCVRWMVQHLAYSFLIPGEKIVLHTPERPVYHLVLSSATLTHGHGSLGLLDYMIYSM